MSRKKYDEYGTPIDNDGTLFKWMRYVIVPIVVALIGAGTVSFIIAPEFTQNFFFGDSGSTTPSNSTEGGSSSSSQAPYIMEMLLADEDGEVVHYNQTLSNGQMIVGNANTLTINGTQYGPACIVFRILPSGSYNISVQGGAILHYANVTTSDQQQSLYQDQMNNIQTYSAQDDIPGTCGVDWELMRIEFP